MQDWKRFWDILESVGTGQAAVPDLAAFGDLLGRSGVSDRFAGHLHAAPAEQHVTAQRASNQRKLLPSKAASGQQGGALANAAQPRVLSAAQQRQQARLIKEWAVTVQQGVAAKAGLTVHEQAAGNEGSMAGMSPQPMQAQGTVVDPLARSPAGGAPPVSAQPVLAASQACCTPATTHGSPVQVKQGPSSAARRPAGPLRPGTAPHRPHPTSLGAVIQTVSGAVAAAQHAAAAAGAAAADVAACDGPGAGERTTGPRGTRAVAKGSHREAPALQQHPQQASSPRGPSHTHAAAPVSADMPTPSTTTTVQQQRQQSGRHLAPHLSYSFGQVLRNGASDASPGTPGVSDADKLEAPREAPACHHLTKSVGSNRPDLTLVQHAIHGAAAAPDVKGRQGVWQGPASPRTGAAAGAFTWSAAARGELEAAKQLLPDGAAAARCALAAALLPVGPIAEPQPASRPLAEEPAAADAAHAPAAADAHQPVCAQGAVMPTAGQEAATDSRGDRCSAVAWALQPDEPHQAATEQQGDGAHLLPQARSAPHIPKLQLQQGPHSRLGMHPSPGLNLQPHLHAHQQLQAGAQPSKRSFLAAAALDGTAAASAAAGGRPASAPHVGTCSNSHAKPAVSTETGVINTARSARGVPLGHKQRGAHRLNKAHPHSHHGVVLPSPRTRYRVIRDGVARMQQLPAVQARMAAKQHAEAQHPGTGLSPLAQWGTAWHATLEDEHAAMQASPRAGHDMHAALAAGHAAHSHLQSGGLPAGTAAAGGLVGQAMSDLSRALQLLDMFTLVVPEQRKRRLDEQVAAQAQAAHEVEVGGPLPPPPHPFPSSAAWDYLVSAQVALGGLAELEEVVAKMRRKVKVVTEVAASGLGVAGTAPLAPIEAGLNISELASVRSSMAGATSLGGDLRHPSMGGGLLDSPLPSPRYFAPYPAPSPRPETTPCSVSRLSLGGAVRLPSSPDLLHGPFHQARSPSFFQDAAASAQQRHSLLQQGCCEPAPAAGSPAGEQGLGLGVPGAARGRKSLSGAAAAGSAAAGGRVDVAAVNELWGWLENLMIEVHTCEAARNEVCGLSQLADAAAAFPVAFNPHTTEPPPLNALTNLVEQMTLVKVAMRGDTSGKALAQAKEVLASIHADQASLRAATLSHHDPAHLARVMHLLLRLVMCLEHGSVPSGDASFLLAASLELLLGELGWLLALLRLQQGPASPHLRALHATLRAHDTQVEYTTRLAGRLDQYRQQLGEVTARARHAEARALELDVQLAVAQQSASGLSTHLAELSRDNDGLTQKVLALEAEVARLRGDMDHCEVQSSSRGELLRHSASFRQQSRKWHLGAVGMLSKGVQACTFGRCSNPHAIPDDEDWEYDDVADHDAAEEIMLQGRDDAQHWDAPPRPLRHHHAGPAGSRADSRTSSLKRAGSSQRSRAASSRRVSLAGVATLDDSKLSGALAAAGSASGGRRSTSGGPGAGEAGPRDGHGRSLQGHASGRKSMLSRATMGGNSPRGHRQDHHPPGAAPLQGVGQPQAAEPQGGPAPGLPVACVPVPD